MDLLRRFWRLPGPKKRALPRALWTVAWIRAALRFLPFRLTQALINRAAVPPTGREPAVDSQLQTLVWAVDIVSQWIPDATCLTQAYAAKILLAKCGYRVDLKIGVLKKEPARLDAHAWLEHDGRVIIGQVDNLADYTPFPNFESR